MSSPGCLPRSSLIILPVWARVFFSSSLLTIFILAGCIQGERAAGPGEAAGAPLSAPAPYEFVLSTGPATSHEYGLSRYEAWNPDQHFRITFTGSGLQVFPQDSIESAWSWGLELAAFGREGAPATLRAAEIVAVGNRMAYVRGDQTEWYVNDPGGIEHGFTLETPPAGDITLPLQISFRVLGDLIPQALEEDEGISFLAPDGGPILRYGSLHAFDADGRKLPADMRVATRAGAPGGRIVLTVHDRAATYPITIDPLISSTTKLMPADLAPLDHYGHSVDLNGYSAIAGSPFHNAVGEDSGAAYVFSQSGDEWLQDAELLPSDLAPLDEFGHAVAIDGYRALVGAPLRNEVGNNSGAAYVFTLSSDGWVQEAKLLPSDLAPLDHFGYSVDISGNTAVIGAPLRNEVGDNSGAAYVFRRSGGEWMEEAKLTPSDLAPLDQFGYSVSVDAYRALIGAPLHNEVGNNSGAAYVFTDMSDGWTQEAKLVPGTLAPLDHFGYSVSISGDWAAAGAPLHNTVGDDAGAAYVFWRSSGGWSEDAMITPSDLAPLDNFGYSVSVRGSALVAGSPLRNDVGNNSGAAYLFRRSSGEWSQFAKLTAGDLAPLDHFGTSVSAGCNSVGVGSPLRNDIGDNSGAAYVFPDLFDVCYDENGDDDNGAPSLPPASGSGGSGFTIKVVLSTSGADANATGILQFRSDATGSGFEARMDKLAPGSYDLNVAGETQTTFEVGSKEQARLKFHTAPEPGTDTLPLKFDPRGEKVEVSQGASTYLFARFPENPGEKTASSPKPPKIRLRAALQPSDKMPGAAAELEFRSNKGRERVRLKLKGAPWGDYTLQVSGVDVGMLHVERGKGKLKFDSEPKKGKLLLNFDPRGRHIKIMHGNEIAFEADFPAE